MKKSIVLFTLAANIAGGVMVADAADPSEPRSSVVRYADLNTTSAEGTALLYRRIRSAAENVCRDL